MTSVQRKRGGTLRLIAYNVLTAFVLFNVIYWTIPTISSSLRGIRILGHGIKSIPPGASFKESLIRIRDQWRQETRPAAEYRSYIAWRRVARATQNINVEGPHLQRRTVNANNPATPKVYFFGGSTMWGEEVKDSETIPSQFAAMTGVHAENFGEGGWTAHQDLMLLIQLLQAGHRPDLVVFYDGVNDVWHKCRAELNPDAHEREYVFNKVLHNTPVPDSLWHYFAPLRQAGENLKRTLFRTPRGVQQFDCHSNPQKAEAIVSRMLQDWQMAKELVEARGGKFIAFLQPVAYFSRTPLDHLADKDLLERLRPEYETLYPMLRARVAQTEFHDIVSALDTNERVYWDHCHVYANGNRMVAQQIMEYTARVGIGPRA